MKQIGVVREVVGDVAVVEVSRKSACEGCHANLDGNCSACVAFGGKSVTAKADNSIGAKAGERVVLESASGTVILYAAAVFLFPLLLGVIGFFVGTLFSHAPAGYAGALIGFALAFLVVWVTLNKRAERRLPVKITEILKSGESC